ncbi:hypothetical protein Y032_0612g667 [Ancylostoma ceylanicum]|uniref:Uncharacterized protein n=1 Tax=Ancylostoma ceylanicum TaxID=53326 RepID=A0A016WN33_9BILA|nr:hypothetical protein Y032_0612g667 [Ancylostoma ceylanicum]
MKEFPSTTSTKEKAGFSVFHSANAATRLMKTWNSRSCKRKPKAAISLLATYTQGSDYFPGQGLFLIFHPKPLTQQPALI